MSRWTTSLSIVKDICSVIALPFSIFSLYLALQAQDTSKKIFENTYKPRLQWTYAAYGDFYIENVGSGTAHVTRVSYLYQNKCVTTSGGGDQKVKTGKANEIFKPLRERLLKIAQQSTLNYDGTYPLVHMLDGGEDIRSDHRVYLISLGDKKNTSPDLLNLWDSEIRNFSVSIDYCNDFDVCKAMDPIQEQTCETM